MLLQWCASIAYVVIAMTNEWMSPSYAVIHVHDEERTFPQIGQRELSLKRTYPTGAYTKHF